jgi:hypothetical protein
MRYFKGELKGESEHGFIGMSGCITLGGSAKSTPVLIVLRVYISFFIGLLSELTCSLNTMYPFSFCGFSFRSHSVAFFLLQLAVPSFLFILCIIFFLLIAIPSFFFLPIAIPSFFFLCRSQASHYFPYCYYQAFSSFFLLTFPGFSSFFPLPFPGFSSFFLIEI